MGGNLQNAAVSAAAAHTALAAAVPWCREMLDDVTAKVAANV